MVLTSLAHYIDIDWLREAYRRTRKNGAAGIDGQTAADYAVNLEGNLQSLLDRAKSGRYRAPAVRRVHIPKGKGATRPIGIPTIEDKVLQRAVLMVLEAVYEQDFLDCSFGFRPGRSPHDALNSLRSHTTKMGGCWLLEVDLRSFFDSVDRGQLREMLRQRVRDGVLIRLIGKWLNAGVVEDGDLKYPDSGTPQGGVISPILANIVLHEVLDKWFENDVKPRLKGRAFLVRFADDFVIGFAREDDARRVWDVLPKRLGRFGLSIHPEKTRLIDFRRPPRNPSVGHASGSSGSDVFDLLGFTYFWGRSLKGYWVMKQKTASSRLTRSIKAVFDWCKAHRHKSIRFQHKQLCAKLRGHYQYFGVIGNSRSLGGFYRETTRAWQKWLHRRSQRRRMTWDRFNALLKAYPLPTPWKRTVTLSA
ncbi:MAG: group II intron reverse transcriptase/maturase [bacterium]|nr:group II intron reverse transcriptase/maturase [bacterium]